MGEYSHDGEGGPFPFHLLLFTSVFSSSLFYISLNLRKKKENPVFPRSLKLHLFWHILFHIQVSYSRLLTPFSTSSFQQPLTLCTYYPVLCHYSKPGKYLSVPSRGRLIIVISNSEVTNGGFPYETQPRGSRVCLPQR